MKIVVLSTDTEQYLLQWWLPHTAKKFDFGVIVDFGLGDESDNTYDLYKKHVPHWRYYKVTQKQVNIALWDIILSKIERDLIQEFPGSWITTLNPTEFLVGNMDFLEEYGPNSQLLIPCHLMNDAVDNENIEPDPNISLVEQRHHGVHYSNDFPDHGHGKTTKLLFSQYESPEKGFHNIRFMRSLHNYNVDYLKTSLYSIGRHYWDSSNYSKKLVICHYNLSPFTYNFIKRKMNIQRRITDSDREAMRGVHHLIDEEKILKRKRFYDQLTTDLKDELLKLE